MFTGRLDAGATTGLGGHGWKFQRRSNPQLGGRCGHLGVVGARAARLEVRGKRCTPHTSRPPSTVLR